MLFSVDDAYRRKLAPILRAKHASTEWLADRPRQGDWNICLVSMGREKMELPFFARCGLAKLWRELRRQGHLVSYQAV